MQIHNLLFTDGKFLVFRSRFTQLNSILIELFFSVHSDLHAKLIFWVKLDLQHIVPTFVTDASKIDVGKDEVFNECTTIFQSILSLKLLSPRPQN